MLRARSLTQLGLALWLLGCSNDPGTPGGGGAGDGGASADAGASAAGGGTLGDGCLSVGEGFTVKDNRYCVLDAYHGYFQVNALVADPEGGMLGFQDVSSGPALRRFQLHSLQGVVSTELELKPDPELLSPGAYAYADGPVARMPGTDLFAYAWRRIGVVEPDAGYVDLVALGVQASASLVSFAGGLAITADGAQLFFSLSPAPDDPREPGLYSSSITGTPPTLGMPQLILAGDGDGGDVALDAHGNAFAVLGGSVYAIAKSELHPGAQATVVANAPPYTHLAVSSSADSATGLLLVSNSAGVNAAAYSAAGDAVQMEAFAQLIEGAGDKRFGFDRDGRLWLSDAERMHVLVPNSP